MSPATMLRGTLLAALALWPIAALPDSAQTPFDLIDNRIVIPVTINGTAGFHMILDTGAPGVSLTPQAARRLDLSLKPAGSVGGAGAGRVAVSSTHINGMTVAGVAFPAMSAIVIDLGPIQRAIGFEHVDGIIGSNVFGKYAFQVDPDRGVLTLWNGAFDAPATARSVPYTMQQGFITFPAQIDSIAGSVLLDTGDRSSLTIFGPFARDHGFYSFEPAVHGAVTGYGVGGRIDSDVIRTQVNAFGYTVKDVLTRVPLGKAGAFDSTGWIASIGNGFMTRFNAIYDLPHQRLVLWPSGKFALLERYDPVGMWIATGGRGPVVSSVLAGGPAEKAGIQAGDTILAVNGIPTRTWPPTRLRAWLDAQPFGSQVTLLVGPHSGQSVSRTVSISQLI